MTSEHKRPLQNFYLELYSTFATDLGDLLEGIEDHCLVFISKRTLE